MRIKTKGIIKKIALVLAGVVALSAVGFGVAKLVEFVKDDLKTINPVFDVGNLGTDGKFVDDESTLYTKEAFECDGLQIKLDFDNQIEYQIYFYDDLDNFVESTEVLSAAYSETVHDGYARIVIMPTNDEDEKISLTERVIYPGQMTIKVSKEQNVEYWNVFNKRLRIVENISDIRFFRGVIKENSSGSCDFLPNEGVYSVTSAEVLDISNVKSISFTFPDVSEESHFNVYMLSYGNNKFNYVGFQSFGIGSSTFIPRSDVTHVVFEYANYVSGSPSSISDSLLESLTSYIEIIK